MYFVYNRSACINKNALAFILEYDFLLNSALVNNNNDCYANKTTKYLFIKYNTNNNSIS